MQLETARLGNECSEAHSQSRAAGGTNGGAWGGICAQNAQAFEIFEVKSVGINLQ